MAKVLHKSQNEVWVFSSKQMGGLKAFRNMIDADNNPLEELVAEVVKEAKKLLQDNEVTIEDIRVETSDLNGPVVNVLVKARII